MNDDPELTAMSAMAKALAPLDDEQIRRVLAWAADRFNVSVDTGSGSIQSHGGGSEETFDSFADLFVAADPKLDREKALVAGYWFQVIQGEDELEARPLNAALKDLGHQVGHITRAFTALAEADPALAVQIRKTGSSRQSTKRYKITAEGVREVERMLTA